MQPLKHTSGDPAATVGERSGSADRIRSIDSLVPPGQPRQWRKRLGRMVGLAEEPRPVPSRPADAGSRRSGLAGCWLAGCWLAGTFAGFAALAVSPGHAEAQEILLTGPLKGAPAVRQLRLYRKDRFEFSPAIGFTLLDEYLRQAIVGARLNYNLTDYFGIGAWGGVSQTPLHSPTGLVGRIQAITDQRAARNLQRSANQQQPLVQDQLTSMNVGSNFEEQLGRIDWIVAPQVTFVPFRGKIALFESLYLDTDLYIFGGPAFVGVTERAECSGASPVAEGGCDTTGQSGLATAAGEPIVVTNAVDFPTATRVAIAPTFGLGFTFYANRWMGLGFEWRAVPFARNTGGFDNHGGGPNNDFPNEAVDAADRDLKLNQMLTVSWNIYLPLDYQVSE